MLINFLTDGESTSPKPSVAVDAVIMGKGARNQDDFEICVNTGTFLIHWCPPALQATPLISRGGNMRIPRAAFICVAMGFVAGLLMSCGGSYGGGGSNPAASLTISVSPTTITLGQSATVTWTANAPCTASGAWSGTKAASGSEMVTPTQAGTLTYTLICSGGGYRESRSESATLTVNPVGVAGVSIGNGCCNRLALFPVIGITTDSGDDRFLLLDTHYVGKVGAAQTAYATCGSCLAGPLKADTNDFKLLAVTPRASVRASIKASNLTSQPETIEFTVPYDESFRWPSSAAAVQGIYTTHLGTGYTLTITIDSAGQIIGNDTNGCGLDGKVSARHPTVGYYDVVLDVNACGTSDGRYGGTAALIVDDTGQAMELFLSASNTSAAIGWRLSR